MALFKCPKRKKVDLTWGGASDAQIAAILNDYYNGNMTLQEVQDIWHVGDVRQIPLSAMNATYVGESHRAQTVDVVILDFNVDNLSSSINGISKALVTVGLKNCLRDAIVSDTEGSLNTEIGYMNDTATNYGGWGDSKRRQWCNDIFYNALPQAHRNVVKLVSKRVSKYVLNNTKDYCWLPSEYEVLGTNTWAEFQEGTQYEYYKTGMNYYKLPGWNQNNASSCYWSRTPYKVTYEFTKFCYFLPGGVTLGTAERNFGIAPSWCL